MDYIQSCMKRRSFSLQPQQGLENFSRKGTPPVRVSKPFSLEFGNMHKKEKIIQAIVQQGVLPLYFHPDETITIQVTEALYSSGIRVVEYTNRGKQALK